MSAGRRSLSIGDALAVAALLAFSVGWLALNIWAFTRDEDADIESGAALVILLLSYGPPFYALRAVWRIVGIERWSERL